MFPFHVRNSQTPWLLVHHSYFFYHLIWLRSYSVCPLCKSANYHWWRVPLKEGTLSREKKSRVKIEFYIAKLRRYVDTLQYFRSMKAYRTSNIKVLYGVGHPSGKSHKFTDRVLVLSHIGGTHVRSKFQGKVLKARVFQVSPEAQRLR